MRDVSILFLGCRCDLSITNLPLFLMGQIQSSCSSNSDRCWNPKVNGIQALTEFRNTKGICTVPKPVLALKEYPAVSCSGCWMLVYHGKILLPGWRSIRRPSKLALYSRSQCYERHCPVTSHRGAYHHTFTDELTTIIKSQKPNKTTGIDGLSIYRYAGQAFAKKIPIFFF